MVSWAWQSGSKVPDLHRCLLPTEGHGAALLEQIVSSGQEPKFLETLLSSELTFPLRYESRGSSNGDGGVAAIFLLDLGFAVRTPTVPPGGRT